MVGDWVFLPKENKPICVKSVHRTMIEPTPESDSDHFVIGEEYLEPIELTPEILTKNGFDGDEQNGVFYCKVGDIVVYVGIYHPDFITVNYQYSTPDGDDTGEIANICKVDGADIMFHELQHTFRLLGINKELNP